MLDRLRLLRRPLWLLAGLVVVAAAAEIGARATLATTPDAIRWYDAATQLKIEQMDDRGDVDVVFAGTSMAWQAFVPEEFDAAAGTTSYNAGLNGGTPEVMERWLLEEVVPRLQPDMVVWGLSSLDLAPNYGPQQRAVYDDALATKTGALAELEQTVAGWSELVANRTVLRSLNDLWGSRADLRDADFIDADDRLGLDGERLDFRINRGDRQREIIQARLRDFEPHLGDVETITRTIAALEAENIEVVLVQLPVPQRFIDAHPNPANDYARLGATIDALATAGGVRFLDMTADTRGSDFVDFTHLDEAPAREFSSRVAAAIVSDRDDRGSAQVAIETDDEPDAPTDCVRRTVIDDYGFEIEISDCPESTPGIDLSVPAEPDVRLASAIESRDRACRNGDDPTTALVEIAASIDAIADRLVDATDQEVAFNYVLVQASVITAEPCIANATEFSVSSATAAITSALDRLFALQDVPAHRSSAIWGHEDRLAVALWIRDAATRGEAVDGLLIGSSIVRTAIDPIVLSDMTDTTVGQAAIGGMSIETVRPWIDEVLANVNPTTIYWGITYYDLYALCHVDRRVEGANDLAEMRTTAFAGLVDDDARRRWDHLLGPAGDAAYGDTPILGSLNLDVVIPGRGLDGAQDQQTRPDLIERQQATVGSIYQPGEPCAERGDVLATEVARLQAAGHEVVLFALPPNPAFAGEHPGGIEGYFDDATEFARIADPDRFIPLEIDVDPMNFLDGTHLLPEGRDQLTAAFGAELAEAVTPPG